MLHLSITRQNRRWNNNIHEWGKSGIISTLTDLEARTESLERCYSLFELSDLEKRVRDLENRDIDVRINSLEDRISKLEKRRPDIGISCTIENDVNRLSIFWSSGLKEKTDAIAKKIGVLENKSVD